MKPNMNDRIARHAEANRQREQQERERVARAIAHRKEQEEFAAWKERMGFDLCLTAMEILLRLEEIRDLNAPKSPDEEWNEEFCRAIELIPEARRFVEDSMMDCIEVKK